MKKKIFIPFISFFLFLFVIVSGYRIHHYHEKHTQEPVSMIIASDMHYLSPAYRGEYFKEPNAQFDGKLIHYSNEYLDAFFAEVLEQNPSVLILSGDLTLNGSQKSHTEFIEKITAIQNAGIPVLVIPGNHDIHTTAGDYTPEEPIIVEGTSSEEFLAMYESFGPAQAISRDEHSFSYIYEVTPYLRLFMLDTNLLSKNRVSSDTLLWVENELKQAKMAGIDVISITHQNLHIHNELLYFTYQLYNADELFALYDKYDVRVNFSGHIHVQSIVSDSAVPEIAVGSLGVCGTPYGQITYNGDSIQYETKFTDVSSYATSINATDHNLLDFNNYSIYYFEEVGRLQSLNKFKESTLSKEEITLLADTFARINSAYFMGKTYDTTAFAEGIALWRTQESNFSLRYIETMLKAASQNNQTLSISLP